MPTTPLAPNQAGGGHVSQEGSGPVRPAPPLPLRAGHRPAFPLHHLPPRHQAVVGALALATQTPPALAALIALAVIALACAKRFVVALRGAWREPVNLYALIVLAPGNRKSAVVSFLTAILDDYERDWNRAHAPAITASQNRHRVLEQKLSRAQSEAAHATGVDYPLKLAEADALAQELAELKVTPPLRLRIDDATPEAIASRLAEQGGLFGVISAEGGLFGNASRYSGGEPNTEILLKAHSGDDTRVDRVGRPPEVIHAPALTIAIAAQLEVLRELGGSKSGFTGRGLPQRFAYAQPESTVGYRSITAPPVPPPIRAGWETLVRAQLDLPIQTNAQGETIPFVVALSPDAQAVFDAFETRLEPELGEFGALASIAEWASKLAGLVGRLAGLFHAVEQAGVAVGRADLGSDDDRRGRGRRGVFDPARARRLQ